MVVFFSSCDKRDDRNDISYKTFKITYYGFDFSEAKVDSTGITQVLPMMAILLIGHLSILKIGTIYGTDPIIVLMRQYG